MRVFLRGGEPGKQEVGGGMGGGRREAQFEDERLSWLVLLWATGAQSCWGSLKDSVERTSEFPFRGQVAGHLPRDRCPLWLKVEPGTRFLLDLCLDWVASERAPRREGGEAPWRLEAGQAWSVFHNRNQEVWGR